MNRSILILTAAVALLVLFTLAGGFYVLPETEQAIITRFGQPVGSPVTKAGIHLKTPFIDAVNRLEKRVLEWDGPSAEMPTKDKLYIVVDAFARWRISDPGRFFIRLKDERSALSRLSDILASEMRNTIARHELVELIRTTKGRKPMQDEVVPSGVITPGTTLPDVQYGRVSLEDEIARAATAKLAEFGVELLDLRFKRINYNPAVSGKIFDRMMSERRQIAERFRSEGGGEAAKILGNKERELKQIDSEAYRKVQVIQGKADAEATTIYAAAFNASPQAQEFFAFQKTMEVYRTAFSRNSTLLLSTENELMRYLGGAKAPVAVPSAKTTPAAQ